MLHRCANPLCVRPDHLFPGRAAPKGEEHGMAKLTEAQVRDIRKKMDEGAVGAVVAQQFGVSTSLVSRIKLNQVWSHL